MQVIYRTSNQGYNKIKPEYVNNRNCLNNFIKNVKLPDTIIADCVNEEYYQELLSYGTEIIRTELGSGAQSFLYMLDLILARHNDSELVYMVENDYLHKPNSLSILEDCFKTLNPDYVTLYDHPDKFIDGSKGGNPQVESGGEITRLLVSNLCHWKMTNSTTMTFAAKVKTLREDYEIILKYIQGTYPRDYEMFLELRERGRVLLSSVPGYSTHGETNWLSPFTDWGSVLNEGQGT